MKANVGSTILTNSFAAGADVVKNSMKGIKIPKIGFLFSSIKYNHDELLKGVKSVAPDLKVIGCTSCDAIMTPDGIISNDQGFAGMLILEDNELSIGVASSSRGQDPRATGQKIAREAKLNAGKKFPPVCIAMFATPGEEEEYLKGIQDELGELPVFGGSASDDEFVGKWKLLCENETTEEGCAIALFYTNKEIKNIFSGYYNETDNIGIITEADNKKIISIDKEPALSKYAEWVETDSSKLMGENVLMSSIKKPIGIKSIQGEILAIRHPMHGNSDESFFVNTKVAPKTAVIQLETDEDGLIEGTVKGIKDLNKEFKSEAMLLMHSAYRQKCIGDRIDEDFVAIKNAVGDIPFIVVFTSNEYGSMDHSGTTIGGLSLSFTGFSEQQL